ncbi:ATP-binding protein [Candidatus Avoscillospira sp. LCP25S3_F1]|uniref:sensor histidine kinase n=1 Tax=Candidatus Avoscillospira sp. LCP25S3_F1 TaxID=3438825 RepID=UPI003F8E1020
MTKRIFRSIFFVALVILLAGTVLIMSVLYGFFNQLQHKQLKTQTDLVTHAVANEGADYLEQLKVQDYRITWIDADGTVLYDTDANASKMENHLDREEVREAIAYGYGESEHYSATLLTRMIYTAERLEDNSIIRVSTVQYSLVSFLLMMLQPAAVMLLASCLLSALLASRLSKKIVEPLNNLNLDDPLSNETYEEVAPLLGRIERQHRQIVDQLAELQQKQHEFDVVTGAMSEGLALLGASGQILSINQSAARLLGTDQNAVGRDILTVNRSQEIQDVLFRARSGQHAQSTLPDGDSEYQLVASPVLSDGQVSGIVLLIFDITEKSHAEQMRREFTANVSHELKTPLHSISGCAEIIKNGIVREADLPQFIDQIYNEAQRLITLVEDIIRLSRLDEGGGDEAKEPVDLLSIARDVVERLKPYAAQQGIQLRCGGESAELLGVPRLLSDILYNLCDNGIKYNNRGGSVTVTVSRQEHEAVVQVQDTGIGIATEHQNRVFERFYRVDKSHSKEIGGTGLGLSIVKHAAMIHNATIELDSALGKGTTITVRFPTN